MAIETNIEDLIAQSENLSDEDLEVDSEDLEAAVEKPPSDGLVEEDFSIEEDIATTQATVLPHSLELLSDIELEIVIELGRTRKTLRDVLQFTPGTTVELNRLAGDEVDVLVNNRRIAKGEVVVYEEVLGVRITSIITPGEHVGDKKK